MVDAACALLVECSWLPAVPADGSFSPVQTHPVRRFPPVRAMWDGCFAVLNELNGELTAQNTPFGPDPSSKRGGRGRSGAGAIRFFWFRLLGQGRVDA